MATVKPFKALRFTEKAGNIADNVCPPYDIISAKQREDYIRTSEHNIIRLELPVGETPYDDAGALYKAWRNEGILACDEVPGFYIYEEEFTVCGERKVIRGLFARVKLHPFSDGVVLPHEETLSKAKTDRFNLMSACYTNFSPVYSMYSDTDYVISYKLSTLVARKADIEFTCPDGIVQRLWKVENANALASLEKAFADKQLFIADGHHRYETALNFREKMKNDGLITSDEDAGNYLMMVLTPMENDGLVVFPTHRLVRGLENFDHAAVLEKIGAYFTVEKIAADKALTALDEGDQAKKAYVLCAKNEYYLLTMRDEAAAAAEIEKMCAGHCEAYKNLDVTVLHSLILERIFGIDKENMAKQINLTYTRDADEAIALANTDEYNCAFLIRPTKVSEIRDVALSGDKMPQKSTYFYPKLITGLVMNDLMQQ